jgi:hypothetical protein
MASFWAVENKRRSFQCWLVPFFGLHSANNVMRAAPSGLAAASLNRPPFFWFLTSTPPPPYFFIFYTGGHNVPYGVDTGDRIWGDGDTGELSTDASDVILGDNGRIDRRFLNQGAPPIFYQPWPLYQVRRLDV